MPQSGSGVTRRQVLAAGVALAAGHVLSACSDEPAGALATARPPDRPTARLGSAEPTFFRFQLGDFEVTTVTDAGAVIDGPCIVEEPSSTTVVHPGQRLRVDELGFLRISEHAA